MKPNPDALVDAAGVQAVLGVPASTLRTWKERGLIKGSGKRGRATLYRYGDVIFLSRTRRSATMDG